MEEFGTCWCPGFFSPWHYFSFFIQRHFLHTQTMSMITTIIFLPSEKQACIECLEQDEPGFDLHWVTFSRKLLLLLSKHNLLSFHIVLRKIWESICVLPSFSLNVKSRVGRDHTLMTPLISSSKTIGKMTFLSEREDLITNPGSGVCLIWSASHLTGFMCRLWIVNGPNSQRVL